jgi:hypothetical protein
VQKLNVVLWMNNPGDWNIEINGCRHEHISSTLIKDLIGCALVLPQTLLVEGTLVDHQEVPSKTAIEAEPIGSSNSPLTDGRT